MSKKVILYARVSTDNQADKGYSLPSQLEACRKYAEQHGFEIVGEFQDDFTGTVPLERRPEGRKVYAMLSSNQADAIIAYTVDRLVRPPEEGDEWDFPVLIRGLARLGKEIHTCDLGKLKTDFASLLIAMLGAKGAGDERRKIVERTTRGRNEKASRHGKVVGSNRAPFGFRFIFDANGKVSGLEIDEPRARIVRLIYQWYVHGDESGKRLSLWAIGNKLTALKIPTPGELRGKEKIRTDKTGRAITLRRGVWGTSAVSNIINNEVYAGLWRYGRRIGEGGKGGRRPLAEQITVNVPQIIDRKTWERAQAQRKHNAAMSNRNAKRDYLLRGVAKCACGRSMAGYFDNRNLTRKRGYRCVSVCYRNRADVCKEKSIDADFAEAYVWACIKRKFENLEKLRSELKAAQQKGREADEPKRAELEAVEEMIQEADQEVDEIARAMRIAKGKVEEKFQRQQDEVNERLERHNNRRDELIAELGAEILSDNSIAEIMQYAQDVKEGIESATFEDKRRQLENLAVKVTIKDGEVADVTGVIAFGISKCKCISPG